MKLKSQTSLSINQAAPLLLLIACLIAYYNCLQNAFMIDDYTFLKTIHQPFSETLKFAFQPQVSRHFSPIYTLFNTLIFKFFHTNLTVLHLINVFLFYGAVFSLYKLSNLLLKDEHIAFLASFLFCLHPINAFTVNYITANFVFIAAIFSALSFMAFWKYFILNNKSSSILIFSFIAQFLAMLTFETTVILPAYFLTALFCLTDWDVKKIFKTVWPYSMSSLIYVGLYIFMTQGISLNELIAETDVNILNYGVSLAALSQWYITNLIVPTSIVFMYNITPIQEHLPFYLSILTGTVGIIILTITCVTKRSLHSFLLLWFSLGFIFVTLAVFAHEHMGLTIEPHWLFFSSFGFFLFLARFISSFQIKPIKFILITTLSLYFVILTLGYNWLARSEKSYGQYWLSVAPSNAFAITLLGKAAAEEGDYTNALTYFKTIADNNDLLDASALLNMAEIYEFTGNHERAKAMINESIARKADNVRAYYKLAIIHFKDKQLDAAEAALLKAYKIDPNHAPTQLELAEYLYFLRRYEESFLLFEAFLENDISPQQRVNALEQVITIAYIKKDLKLAFNNIAKLTSINNWQEHTTDSEKLLMFGVIVGNYEQWDAAIEFWELGLKYNPDDVRFITNIQEAIALKHQN